MGTTFCSCNCTALLLHPLWDYDDDDGIDIIAALWDFLVCSMLGRQLKLNFMLFRLNILCRTWSFGNADFEKSADICSTLLNNIVYQATLSTNDGRPDETYGEMAGNTFKLEKWKSQDLIRNSSKRTATELSKHIWDLTDNNTDLSIKWHILKRAEQYRCAAN